MEPPQGYSLALSPHPANPFGATGNKSKEASMSHNPPREGWPAASRIFAAEGKFLIDHDGGRLVAQLTYLSGTPSFVVYLENETPERNVSGGHHILLVESLPELLEHVAAVIRHCSDHDEASRTLPVG